MVDLFILFLSLCVECYIKHSAVSEYIYVHVADNGDMVAYFFAHFFPESWVMRSKSSESGEYVARLKPSKAKLYDGLKNAYKSVVLGNVDTIRAMAVNSGLTLNNGQLAEYAIYAYYGMATEYRLDNIPFDVAADVVIDGIGYQVKSYSARLMSETTLKRFGVESPIHGEKP